MGNKGKKKIARSTAEGRYVVPAKGKESQETRRAGMPARDSVVSEKTLKSPKGNVYRLLKTDETDETDETDD